jgi:hypothetical protein
MPTERVQQALKLAQVLDVFSQQVLVLLVRLVNRRDLRGQLLETHLITFADAKFLGGDFHGLNLGQIRPRWQPEIRNAYG